MNPSESFLPSSELTSLLARLGVGSSVGADRPPGLCIVASIINLGQIEQAHGAGLVQTVRYVVHERARLVCRDAACIMAVSGDHLLFVFDVLPPPQPQSRLYAPSVTFLLERIQTHLGNKPVDGLNARVFPVISVAVAQFTDDPFDIDSIGATARLHGQGGRQWREQFIADTNVAETLFRAIDERRLCFEWEPICDAQDGGRILYYEALLCELTDAGLRRVGNAVAALERLGLVRRLDQWVVESVLEALRLNPGLSLGCNVSAQSARLDPWWAFTFDVLSEAGQLASRLIVEITETAPLTEMEVATKFVKSLQQLGCRIALDDIGRGYSNLGVLIDLGVDIAKIGADCLRKASGDDDAVERFQQLVGLASMCASDVVIEGVESDADLKISRSSRATGLQGYLYPKAGAEVIRLHL